MESSTTHQTGPRVSLLGIAGCFLLGTAVFLPILVGPSIEGMLGFEPNMTLGTRKDGPISQSWLGTGRGEQILFLLVAVGGLAAFSLGSAKWRRSVSALLCIGFVLGALLTVNRVRHVYADYSRVDIFREEDARREAILQRKFPPLPPPDWDHITLTKPLPRPPWRPSYGIFFFLAGLFCIYRASPPKAKSQRNLIDPEDLTHTEP